MQLVDRIERRRFVGREFLLWLWFESEALEATLHTKEHGPFGLWIEGELILSAGKEVTRIKGSYPGGHREAKESLRRGKLPERAGLHLSIGERESSFVLKSEAMAIASLKLPTVLSAEEEDEAPALDTPRKPPPRKRRGGNAEAREAEEAHETHEAFYERMRLTREVETILEALYRDFLALRLGPAWGELVMPSLETWVDDGAVDGDTYRSGRERALGGGSRKR